MFESELVSKVIDQLQREGFRVLTEVSNMGQSVDVVGTRGKWVTFVEVKTRNWSRAMEQCEAHQQIADFICIAIASVSVPVRLVEAATLNGYGLLHYRREQNDVVWIVRPRRNTEVWPPQRKYWATATRKVAYAN
jgi:Holliday junction resolvase